MHARSFYVMINVTIIRFERGWRIWKTLLIFRLNLKHAHPLFSGNGSVGNCGAEVRLVMRFASSQVLLFECGTLVFPPYNIAISFPPLPPTAGDHRSGEWKRFQISCLRLAGKCIFVVCGVVIHQRFESKLNLHCMHARLLQKRLGFRNFYFERCVVVTFLL